MNEPARVALISQPHDPVSAGPHPNGSVAIVLLEIARRLARTHRVTVYAPSRRGQARVDALGPNLSIERIPFVFKKLHSALDLAVDLCGGKPRYFTWDIYFEEFYTRVARRIAATRPDVVHLMTYPQALPRLRAAAPGARLVLHAHDGRLLRLPPVATARRLSHADAVVTCSAWLARAFGERFPRLEGLFHTIGNGVDVDRFRPAEVRRAAAGLRVLYIGRVSPEKGVHLLIDAFAALAPDRPDLHLAIVGPAGLYPLSVAKLLFDDTALQAIRPFYGRGLWSRMRHEIVGAATSYPGALQARIPAELTARVTFQPSCPHELVPEIYRAADVAVLPSVFDEPFGMPAVEAMASGLPVIATAVGGIPELVTPECGILVERGRAAALRDALRLLLEQPARRLTMGEAGRRRAIEAFRWDDVVARLDLIYRQPRGADHGPRGGGQRWVATF